MTLDRLLMRDRTGATRRRGDTVDDTPLSFVTREDSGNVVSIASYTDLVRL